MTCTCKQEIASILRKQAGINDALGTLDTDLSPVRQVLAKTLSDIADRLSPAPAEPQEPLTGWRAKCGPHTGSERLHDCDDSTPWILRYDPDGKFVYENSLWYCGGKWELPHGTGPVTQFPTRAAAVAALLAASEPGKAASIELPKCMYCEYPLMAGEIGACRRCVPQPAPASTPAGKFDAKAAAAAMFKHNDGKRTDCINISHYDSNRGWSVMIRDDRAADTIMHFQAMIEEYGQACHAAGRAEGDAAGYKRGMANGNGQIRGPHAVNGDTQICGGYTDFEFGGFINPDDARFAAVACSLDHAAVAAELRAKDAEIAKLKAELDELRRTHVIPD